METKTMPVPQFNDVKFGGKDHKESMALLNEWLDKNTSYLVMLDDLGQDISRIWIHETGEILHTDLQSTIYVGSFVDVSSEEKFDWFRPLWVYNPKFNQDFDVMNGLVVNGITKMNGAV